jgi:predicted PurR-regulated permease PerM
MATNNDLETPITSRPAEKGIDPAATPVRVVNYSRIILFAAGLYLAIAFIDAIARALLLFLTAFLIAIVLNAPVRWLENRGIKRGISAAGVALIVLGGLVTAGFVAGPPLTRETTALVQNAPERWDRFQERLDNVAQQYPALRGVLRSEALETERLMQRAQALLPRIGRYTLGLFGSFAAGFFVLVIALYTLGSPKPLVRGLVSAVPQNYRTEATHALTRIIGQLESWALATLLLMLIVGVVSGLGLWLLKVPNALLFGIIAGFGEAIPTIGPILSALPPMAVSLADEPTKALWVAGLFLLVQQLENNVLVPMIMARNLNLHPVSILFFVLALGAFVGVLGAILAVPTAIIVKVLFEEFYGKKSAPRQEALDEAADQILRAGSRPGKTNAPRPPEVSSL